MVMMLLIITLLSVCTSSILSFPKVSPPPSPANLGLALSPHLDDLIDPTLSCSSDWQCPYRWYCLEHTCTKENQLDEDRLAGSAFALAIQSLLVFGSLTLFLCSPCLSLIFFGYYLGYCPTGVVDRSKGGSGGGVGVGGGGEKEVVAQQMIVVEKRSKRGESRELPTRSGKSKRKRKALKISEAQAQVLAQVNQLTPPPPQVIASSAALEKHQQQSKLQIEPAGTLAEKADDDMAPVFAAKE